MSRVSSVVGHRRVVKGLFWGMVLLYIAILLFSVYGRRLEGGLEGEGGRGDERYR